MPAPTSTKHLQLASKLFHLCESVQVCENKRTRMRGLRCAPSGGLSCAGPLQQRPALPNASPTLRSLPAHLRGCFPVPRRVQPLRLQPASATLLPQAPRQAQRAAAQEFFAPPLPSQETPLHLQDAPPLPRVLRLPLLLALLQLRARCSRVQDPRSAARFLSAARL